MLLWLSPKAFWNAFIHPSCPWAGTGAGVWFLLQGRRAIMPSLVRRKKGCVWTEITSHLNRVLGGTFLAQKLLSLAILTLFQSNIFLAILGYMDLSQHRGWCMSRTSDFFFLELFFYWLRRNGDKCGSEQILKCGWKWKLSAVKRIRHSSWEWCPIFQNERHGEMWICLFQCTRSSAKPCADKRKSDWDHIH